MNWVKVDKYIGVFITGIILIFLAMTANAFDIDRDINMLWLKLQIVAAIALVMVIGLVFYRHERKVNPTMEARSYRFDASLFELIGVFFRKNECPYCNSKLRLVKKKIYQGKDWISFSGGSTCGNIYKIRYLYECDSCQKQIKLSELGKKHLDINKRK